MIRADFVLLLMVANTALLMVNTGLLVSMGVRLGRALVVLADVLNAVTSGRGASLPEPALPLRPEVERTDPLAPLRDAILGGAHTRYVAARLGAVTAIHPQTGSGGLSFVTEDGEHKFLLSGSDLQILWTLLHQTLAAYRRTNSQSCKLSDGFRSDDASPDGMLK